MARYRAGYMMSTGHRTRATRHAAGVVGRAFRRYKRRTTVQKLKRDVSVLKSSTQYKHLHTYRNVPSTELHSAVDNQPAANLTFLWGETATGIPADVAKAAQRENNKILVNSVNIKLLFHASQAGRANYTTIRVMLIKVPDSRNIANTKNFELQNFLQILDSTVGYCYTNASKRSILNDPALGLQDGITAYKVLVDKVVTLRSVLATANNSAANNNSPQYCNIYYKFPKGLQTSYSTDQPGTCYRNNLILHLVPSNVGPLPAAPSADMMTTIRWQET